MNTIRYALGDSSLGPFVAALSGRGLASWRSMQASPSSRRAFRTPIWSRTGRRWAETIGKLAA